MKDLTERADARNSDCGSGRRCAVTREYAITALRSAGLRARLVVNDADLIGIALDHGMVTPASALIWARDAGVLDLVGDEDIEAAAEMECGR